MPFDGTTYAAAVAHWGHTYNGKWNPARVGDQNDKNLNFYSIYALGGTPPPNAHNLLWQIAKYGGFVDGNSNNLPDSGEWDGHNYIEANDAYQLESALTNIFYEIASVGAAGAVATVTQQMENDDLLVRGGFETDDPNNIQYRLERSLGGIYPVRGVFRIYSTARMRRHCRLQLGMNSCTGSMYSFQKPSNWGKFCSASDTANGYCWDARQNNAGPRFKNYLHTPRRHAN